MVVCSPLGSLPALLSWCSCVFCLIKAEHENVKESGPLPEDRKSLQEHSLYSVCLNPSKGLLQQSPFYTSVTFFCFCIPHHHHLLPPPPSPFSVPVGILGVTTQADAAVKRRLCCWGFDSGCCDALDVSNNYQQQQKKLQREERRSEWALHDKSDGGIIFLTKSWLSLLFLLFCS